MSIDGFAHKCKHMMTFNVYWDTNRMYPAHVGKMTTRDDILLININC